MKDFFNKLLKALKEALSENGQVSSKRCIAWILSIGCLVIDIISVCREGMTANNKEVTIVLIGLVGLLLGITKVTEMVTAKYINNEEKEEEKQ